MRGLILLFGVPVFVISLVLLFRHYNRSSEKSNQKRISHVQSLIQEGKQTEAIFDSTYSILKIHGEEKQFSLGYHYTVNAKTYEDVKYFDSEKELPTERTFPLFYLEKDPSIHSDNPKKELETLRVTSKEESTPKYGWWLFCISTLGFVYLKWSATKERKRQEEMEEMTQQYNNR
jgi:hypothetical protein